MSDSAATETAAQNPVNEVPSHLCVTSADELQDMPEEYQQLVKRQLMKHTEGELSGADDYAVIFYPMAPNAYEKEVCLKRGLEELEHYKLGANLLKDIGISTRDMETTPLSERQNYGTEGVKQINDWIERGLFSFVGEDAVMAHLIEMRESSYKPIAEMMKSVIVDEQVHVAHGYRIIRDLCKTAEGREEVNKRLIRMWPATLDLFGKSDSRTSQLYLKWGLRTKTNEQARQDFAAYARGRLEALGLTVPDDNEGRKFT